MSSIAFNARIDTSVLSRALRRLGDDLDEALYYALKETLGEVLEEARNEVPVDTGALHDSGFVVQSSGYRDIMYHIGFGRADIIRPTGGYWRHRTEAPTSAYAWRQHVEHKTRSYYLERPLFAMARSGELRNRVHARAMEYLGKTRRSGRRMSVDIGYEPHGTVY